MPHALPLVAAADTGAEGEVVHVHLGAVIVQSLQFETG